MSRHWRRRGNGWLCGRRRTERVWLDALRMMHGLVEVLDFEGSEASVGPAAQIPEGGEANDDNEGNAAYGAADNSTNVRRALGLNDARREPKGWGAIAGDVENPDRDIGYQRTTRVMKRLTSRSC